MKHLLLIAIVIAFNVCNAQDIHFSQYMNSNQLINPALTGMFRGDLMAQVQYKDQWNSWNNGYKDGAHIQIEDSGMWEIIYENGKRISWDKLGFSGSENIENHENKKEFFEMANPGFKFKKRYDIDEDMIRDPLKERKKVIF